MGRLIGVFGSSGFGREVMPLVRRQLVERPVADTINFVEKVSASKCNGIPVIAESAFFKDDSDRAFVVAIANGVIRKRLFEKAMKSGADPLSIQSGSAEIFDEATLGAGYILCGHSTVSSNTTIGAGFHLNVASYVAHDCQIGDFVTFGPNVVCAGNVIVEDMVYIGAGALIRNGALGNPTVIGKGAVVGMGAVVTRSVLPGAVVAGNPARELKKDRMHV